MKLSTALVLGMGLALQTHALLIEGFKNNQVDYVPSIGFGQASNTVNGYLYGYRGPSTTTISAVSSTGASVAYSTTMFQAATVFQADSGLVMNSTLALTGYPFAGVGMDWVNVALNSPKEFIDLTGHTSVIVKYKSNQPLKLEWSQNTDPAVSDGSEFFCVLPVKTVMGSATCLLQSGVGGFNQPSWVIAQARDFDLTQAIGLKVAFKVDSSATISIYTGESAHFVLNSIHLDNINQEWPVVSSSSAASSVTPSSSVIGTSSVVASSSAIVASSSSVVVVSSSSSAVVVSSSSAALATNLVWIPSLVNQVEFNGVAGGFLYSFADSLGSATPTSADLALLSGSESIVSVLTPGAVTNPFAAIGFDWKDNGIITPKGVVNMTAKTSICVSYTSSKAVSMVLKQQDIGDACPQYVLTLPVAVSGGTAEMLLSGFKKEGSWGGAPCAATINRALQTGVHFQTKATPAASLTISKIGFDGYCGTPTVIVGVSSSVVSSSSSLVRSSSSSTIIPVSSSSVIIPVSSSSATIANPLCLTVLPGQTSLWMLGDDNGDGTLNYMESTHPCYQGSTVVLGVKPDAGFGFVKMNGREIAFRTYESGTAKLDVFGTDGRLVSSVFNGSVSQGVHTIAWNGATLPGGVYMFRLVQGKQSRLIRAVLTH
jgi:hypothetical protein